MSIKNDLYTILNNIGKEDLQIEFQNNINSSIPKIKEIISRAILMRNQVKNKENGDTHYSSKYYPLLCEAFLHFLLTATFLSSQRKIKINDLEIDLVIPDLRTLNQDPQKAIIIKFDKDIAISDYITRLQNTISIPQNNLWLVSSTPLFLPYRNYVIFKNKLNEQANIPFNDDNIDKDTTLISNSKKINDENLNSYLKNRATSSVNLNVIPFFNIIVDISKFLKDTNHTSFKLLP
ncbi:MAG TPA: hypothetical protein VFV86_10880 [Nitrososphaeraceae archaeon]|nr:hypothetical protein [Nitrososphaeraceae archaeon]